MFTSLQNNSNLEEIFQGLLDIIANEKKKLSTARAGLVSGIVNSDGPEHKKSNRELLKLYAKKLRKQYHFPIISSPDIFTDELYEKLKRTNTAYEDFDRF